MCYEQTTHKNPSFFFSDTDQQTPTVVLWTYYYLAQHFDLLCQTDKALEYINCALEHTVTLIELYMVKARIYKVSTKHHLQSLLLRFLSWQSND